MAFKEKLLTNKLLLGALLVLGLIYIADQNDCIARSLISNNNHTESSKQKPFDLERQQAIKELTVYQENLKNQIPGLVYYEKASDDNCARRPITEFRFFPTDDDNYVTCAYRLTYIYGLKAKYNQTLLNTIDQYFQDADWHSREHYTSVRKLTLNDPPDTRNISYKDYRQGFEFSMNFPKFELEGYLANKNLNQNELQLIEFTTSNNMNGHQDGEILESEANRSLRSLYRNLYIETNVPTDLTKLISKILNENDMLLTVTITKKYVDKHRTYKLLKENWVDVIRD